MIIKKIQFISKRKYKYRRAYLYQELKLQCDIGVITISQKTFSYRKIAKWWYRCLEFSNRNNTIAKVFVG